MLVEEVDPVQNTDTLNGRKEEALGFPFIATKEDLERVRLNGIANE